MASAENSNDPVIGKEDKDGGADSACARCSRPCRSDIMLHCRHRLCLACASRAYALQDPNRFLDKKITCPVEGCGVTDQLSRQSLEALLGGNLLPSSSNTYASERREKELLETLRRDLPGSRYRAGGAFDGNSAAGNLSRMRVYCSLCRKSIEASGFALAGQGAGQGSGGERGAVHCGTCNQMFCQPCAKSIHLSGLGCKENGRHALSFLACDASGRNWVRRKAFTELRVDAAENLHPSNRQGTAFEGGTRTGGRPTTQRLSPDGPLHSPRQGLLKMWHPTYVDYLDPLREDTEDGGHDYGHNASLPSLRPDIHQKLHPDLHPEFHQDQYIAQVRGDMRPGSNDTLHLLEKLDDLSLIGDSTVPGLTEGKASLYNFKCPSHPDEPVQFRCVTCNTPSICAKCCIGAPNKHQTHEVLDLQSAFERIRYELSLPDWLGREAARLRLQSLLRRCVAAADQLEGSFRAVASCIVEGQEQAVGPLQRFDQAICDTAQKLEAAVVKACTISDEDAAAFEKLTHMLHEAEIKYKIATDSQLCSWFFRDWMKMPGPNEAKPQPAKPDLKIDSKAKVVKSEAGKMAQPPQTEGGRSRPSSAAQMAETQSKPKAETMAEVRAAGKPTYLQDLRLLSESRFARAYRSELMLRWFQEMAASALRDANITEKQLCRAADYAANNLRGSGTGGSFNAKHHVPVSTQAPSDDAGFDDRLMNLHDSFMNQIRRTRPFVAAANPAAAFNFSAAEKAQVAQKPAAPRRRRTQAVPHSAVT